jgi:hypothetical protein
MHSLRIQANEMSAVLSVFLAHARVNAEQVGIGAVGAFPQGNTRLWNGQPAGAADGEEVFASHIVLAVLAAAVIFNRAENPASHENVRMLAPIRLNLIEAFINPIYAIFAMNHDK